MQEQETYSPFWICLIVFVAILATGVTQTFSLYEQRNALKAAEKNVKQAKEKYQVAQVKIEGLAKDLVAISATNDNAKKIVKEFDIKVAAPKGGSSAPAASAKPTTTPAKK